MLVLACAAPQLLAEEERQGPGVERNEQKRAVHALNRLTFGPRPGDLQQVMAVGVDRWIDLQLHPEKIPDSAMESRLAPFRTLRMSTQEMVEEFPDGQMIKQVMDGKRSMPSDPARRAVFQVQIARLQERQEEKKEQRTDRPSSDRPSSRARSVTCIRDGEDRRRDRRRSCFRRKMPPERARGRQLDECDEHDERADSTNALQRCCPQARCCRRSRGATS